MSKPRKLSKLFEYKVNRGYIFDLTRKNVITMLFWALLLFALYCWYMTSGFVYFCNAFSSGYKLDSDRFFANSNSVYITPQSEFFDTSSNYVTIPPMLMLKEVYRDGIKYRFKVTIESYTEVGLAYSIGDDSCLHVIEYNPQIGRMPQNAVQKIAIIGIDGKKAAALLPPEDNYTAGETIPYACFSLLQKYVGHDLGTTDFAGSELLNYSLDMRYLAVDDEINDFILVLAFSVAFPLFLLFTIFLLFKPQFHPNYIRINKFGDINKICADIDTEIRDEGTYKDGRSVYTKHYIIYHSLHSTKVQMNHLLRN